MKNKVIVFLIIATAGLGIGLGTSLHQRNEIKSQLNTVQSEATSLQNELSKTDKDLQKKIKKNTELQSELDEVNQIVEDLKGSEYKLVYMGDFKLTHYCAELRNHICGYGKGITATGTKITVGRTVAVDPKKIPYGTKIYIEGYGWRIAEDCGPAVQNNQIDILVNTHEQALNLGTKTGGVWILVENS